MTWIVLVALMPTEAALAQQPIVYPAKGQSAEQQQSQQALATYNRAVAACLEGRGYTIN